ncbi:XRE family transcriptional regulator [Parabacteroides sp. AF48-14]|nr:XRE family transcriptional regulator [Parabacteroides sp. AF48-14]
MIRESIKDAMDFRKIKSKDLAEYIGVTKSSMSLFLNGKRAMGQEKLEAMLDYLKIKLVREEELNNKQLEGKSSQS